MIPSLEDLSLNQRAVLTIAIVVLVIMLLAVVGFMTGRWEAEGAPRPLTPLSTKWDSHILDLEKTAIDEAFRKHIGRLYDIWVTDYRADEVEPPRAVKGAANGRAAYVRAMEAIEQRERALGK